VAYDQALAERVRGLVARPGVAEKRMFGGLAFLLHGHLAVAASSRGGLLVRVDPAEGERLLTQAGAEPMVMSGRPTRGWLHVRADAVAEQAALQTWVERGVRYAESLPPKP